MGLDWEALGVLDDFRRCQRASQTTDLIFHCANGDVSAHQMIFVGISRLFTDLMQRYVVGQELIPMDLNISLPEIRLEHMEMVVEMVYTGQVRITRRDYQPFREICKLLDLCVPIADYDKFFMNQCADGDDDSTSNNDVQYSEAQMSAQVSIPLKSWPDSRVFVCDQCDDTFSLKVALKRHKENLHCETELQSLDTTDSPEPSEMSNSPNVELSNQGPSSPNSEKPLSCIYTIIECPECLERYSLKYIRMHFTTHLQEQLDKLVTVSESVPGRRKCKLCPYGASDVRTMRRHVGVTHNKISEFANESQKKFLDEVDRMIPKVGKHPRKSSKLMDKMAEPRKNLKGKQSNFAANGEPSIECSECHLNIKPARARHHLVCHMWKQLNKFVIEGSSANEPMKCKLCQYVSSFATNVRRHLGLTHNFVVEFANEAQKQFLHDADKKSQRDELSGHPSSNRDDSPTRSSLRRRTKHQFKNLRSSKLMDKMAEPRKNLKGKQSNFAANGEPSIECSECHLNIKPARARHHLVCHMWKQLNKFVIEGSSANEPMKCKLCQYVSPFATNVRRHLGLTHNFVVEFANEAQKQFLHDADKKSQRDELSGHPSSNRDDSPTRSSLRRRTKHQFKNLRSTPADDDLSEMEDNCGEIENDKR